jgi:hypothetical protein
MKKTQRLPKKNGILKHDDETRRKHEWSRKYQ